MTADYSERLRQAVDPATDPAELADLAFQHPELRPLIAANPTAYDGLLDWMAGLGDPAVLAALAARPGSTYAVPAAVAPVAASAYQGAVSYGTAVETVPFAAPVVPVARERRPVNRRLLLGVGAGAVVLALVAGGGVFAVNLLLTGGSATDSAKAFPATTFGWQEVAVDPSVSQKLAAVEILGNLSEVQDLIKDEGPDIDYDEPDIKKSIWDYYFDNDDFPQLQSSLDYEDDVKPWLGSRIALGQIGSAPSASESLIVAIEATNVDLGVTAVVDWIEDRELEGLQVSSRSGYVVITDEDVDLDAAYAAGTLDKVSAFSSASSKLGDWGISSSWSRPRAAMEASLAWATDQAGEGGEQSLEYWQDYYGGWVDSYNQEVADYNSLCPPRATYVSSYCRSYSAPSEYDFYESNGFYPGDVDEAARDAQQSAIDESKDLVDNAQAVIDAINPDASYAAVIRASTGGVLEMVVVTSNVALPEFASPQHVGELANLPDTTMAAASVSQGGSIIDTAVSPEYFAIGFASQFMANGYSSLYSFSSLQYGDGFPDLIDNARDSYDEGWQRNLGIGFPDGLTSALGTNALIAVDKDLSCTVSDFTYDDGGCSDPKAAIVIYSDDLSDTVDTVDDLVDTLDESYDTGIDIEEGDGRMAISRGGYGKDIMAGGGALGSVPSFATALPDLGGAFAAAYLDVDALLAEIEDQRRDYSDQPLQGLQYFRGISAAGLTATKTGNGDISIKIRIVTGKD